MNRQNNNRLKANYDLLEAQQQEYANNGEVLKNIFSISAKHPFLSLVFVISLNLLTSTLFELVAFLTAKSDFDLRILLLLTLEFILIPMLVVERIRTLHKDLFITTPINQKRLLITLISPRTDFRDMPSYAVYESILYSTTGYAAVNSLQKVILVTSESPDVQNAATNLKTHIEASGREATITGIAINNRSLFEIQKQIELIIKVLMKTNKPYEIITDYTGGTKDMSIGLLRASEEELVLPIYLNDAATTNHSRYN